MRKPDDDMLGECGRHPNVANVALSTMDQPDTTRCPSHAKSAYAVYAIRLSGSTGLTKCGTGRVHIGHGSRAIRRPIDATDPTICTRWKASKPFTQYRVCRGPVSRSPATRATVWTIPRKRDIQVKYMHDRAAT
ncbi:hypothetical protein H310_14435 [Aphanomyces invadans]|uniref:Uncharacterized protein n=1 Tax=Aphanomyces invadans TaxID=157072 RepID=A0A024T9N0_9STRA|nr:hypothetical protein H310_14435 [Aphanomyces invadans]ETV90840.1 hypothetical protein H310_14435 [Aphanomyces invadans]|eukprot:XP_008880518.1 hypothetical protein H310_14435 [Aphanomyces invadans]